MPTQQELQKQYKWKKGKPVYNSKNQLIIDSNGNLRGELRSAASSGGSAAKNPSYNLGIDGKTGAINPKTATNTVTGATASDTVKNFYMNNPGAQVDAYGNQQNIAYDPATGQTSIQQTAGSGLTAANQAFTNAALGLGNDGRKQAQDAAYSYYSQNLGRDRERELQKATNDMVMMGVSYSADPNSRWQRTVNGVEEKYRTVDDQARNQAVLAGNQTYATNVSAVGTLGTTAQAMSPTFTAFQGGASNQGAALMQLLGTISEADMAKYGIDKDAALKLKQLAAAKATAGGGGGSPVVSGAAPGFNV